MAVSAKAYANLLVHLANKRVDLDTDTFKVLLLSSSYTPDQGAHDFANDLTGELATGSGYTNGGISLGSITATLTGNVLKWDAADVVVTVPDGSTLTARYAVVVDTSPGTAATNPLISYVDFGTDVIVSPVGTSGSLTIQWDANGIATFTVA